MRAGFQREKGVSDMGGKVLHRLLKYQFLLIFLATGVSYISLSQNWQLYAEPAREIAELFGWEPAYQPGKIPDTAEEGSPAGSAQGDGSGTDPAMPEGANPVDTPPEDDSGPLENAGEAGLPEMEQKTFQTVDETYFQDALFIGDSRTVGLRDYGRFETGPTFYASKGLTIFKLLTAEIVEQEGQRKKITVEEALGQKQFQKIYLMVGINELGTGDAEKFGQAYREVVERIRELQPDAIIYIQSILKVTQERSEQGDYINNEGVIARNEAIQTIADGKTIFYLDVNEAVCDESGCLNPEYSGDGVHITAKYIYLWKDYLMSHAIEM